MSNLYANAAQEYILGPDPAQSGGFAVMPLKRVHMLGGASGSGKTTMLFQMLAAAQKGEPFLGYPTQWHPSVYVAFDRREEETEETMARVGLDPASVPHYFWEVTLADPRVEKDGRLENIVRDIRNKHPEVKVIYFDAFYILAQHGRINDYQQMAYWLQRAGILCENLDLTIIGIVHSAKARKGQEITDPRYSITGSVATGGFTSCQVIVEKPSLDNPDKRLVHVYPRNAPEQIFDLITDDRGCLVPDEGTEDAKLLCLEHFFTRELPPGQAAKLMDIAAYMRKKMNASKSAVQRYIDQLIEEGKVAKYGRGIYVAVVTEDLGDYAEAKGNASPWA